MELQRRQDQDLPERKGQKRKLEEEIEEEQREISSAAPFGDARQALLNEVSAQVNILNSTFSWHEADRAAAKRATHILAELAKNGNSLFFFLPFPESLGLLFGSQIEIPSLHALCCLQVGKLRGW